jgi:hypothetical protein
LAKATLKAGLAGENRARINPTAGAWVITMGCETSFTPGKYAWKLEYNAAIC